MSGPPMYHAGSRQLQDRLDSRRIADRLEEVTVHDAFSEKDRELIERSPMFFLATADAARSRTFYQSVLGLRLIVDDPFALVFDANGVMVRIQKVDAVAPAAYTTLGWKVRDIDATVRHLGAMGVQFERFPGLNQDDLGVWRSPSGGRIAWFKDPEGHILSLTQF